MPEQPNKPDGEFEKDGEVRPEDERGDMKNQSHVTPDQYPEPAGGETGAVQKP